jgi:signal transduction histidine kinase
MVLIPDQLPGTGVLRLRKPVSGIEDYYVLLRPMTTIGRHPSNTIPLPKSSVSRYHARVERNGESYYVEDLNSSNGTFVNGQPVRSLEIKNRDTVIFGDVEFTFYLDEETTPRHPTRADTTQVRLQDGAEGSSAEVLRTHTMVDPEKAMAEISEIRSVSQALRYLRTHYRLLEIIRQRPSEERLLDNFLELLFDVIRADRGVIMLIEDGEDNKLLPAAVHFRHDMGQSEEVKISQTITSKCIREQLAILSADLSKDVRFTASQSIAANKAVRSAICVPLVIRQRVLGVCYLDTETGVHAFDEADLRFVANLSSQLALALDNLRMTRERMQAEQLSIIGRTMTEVAHNIKNVLLVTKGGVEMMDRNLVDGDMKSIKSTWELVRRGMDRMNRMAADMLSYARLEDRKRREVRVNEIISEAVDQLSAEMESLGVRLEFQPDEEAPACWLDPVGFFDVVANLLVNAREAIPSGTPGHIEVKTGSGEAGMVEVHISDNGMGIAPEEKERVFLPFYTTKDHGTGMGLPMVKRFVTEMGGTIEVLPRSEGGTTFLMVFPVARAEDEEGASAKK